MTLLRLVFPTLVPAFLILAAFGVTTFAQTEGKNLTAAQVGGRTNNCGVRLPDISIKPNPANDVPAEAAAFLGVWGDGMWDGGKLCNEIIVSEVGRNAATVYYTHGTYDGWGIGKPGYRKVTGRIDAEKRKLYIYFKGKGNFPYAIYTLRPDGRLDGVYVWRYRGRSYSVDITLKRITDPFTS